MMTAVIKQMGRGDILVMKRAFVAILIGVFFFLGAQVEVAGENPGGEDGDAVGESRLFYLFSAEVAEHLVHARQLQDLLQSQDRRLQIVGIVRGGGDRGRSAGSLEEFGRRHGLAYPLLSAVGAAVDGKLPAVLRAQLERQEDYALLVDSSGRMAGVGTGRELGRFFSSLADEHVSTDVDESTWGKIKELFQ